MRLKALAITAMSVLAAGAVNSAMAADLPVKAAPVVAVAPAWAGCYIGGHAGGVWARNQWTNTVNSTLFGDLSPGQGFSQSVSGFIGGGQIGCNWQNGALVYGIEGTLAWSSAKGSLRNNRFGSGLDDVFTHKIGTVATLAGRIGVAMNQWLPYFKFGYAGADVELSVSDVVPANVGAGSDSKWHHGFVIGGGVEYMLTRNWILGAEYNFLALQTKSYNLTGASAGLYTFDMRPRAHTLVGRLSYKF